MKMNRCLFPSLNPELLNLDLRIGLEQAGNGYVYAAAARLDERSIAVVEEESRALELFHDLSQDIGAVAVVVVAAAAAAAAATEKNNLEAVAFVAEEHMASMKAAVCYCRAWYCTAVAATVVLETVVAGTAVAGMGTQQAGADCGIVAPLGCLGSIRQKPSLSYVSNVCSDPLCNSGRFVGGVGVIGIVESLLQRDLQVYFPICLRK